MKKFDEDFLLEIRDTLKYAIKSKNWSDICDVVEMINEELNITEKVDYVSARDEDYNEEDDNS